MRSTGQTDEALHAAIALLPFADATSLDLGPLARDLAACGATVTRLASMELPPGAFNTKRRQYDAHALLERVARVAARGRILGVTAADLYVPRLNFVFGLAHSSGRAAIISLARLHAADPAIARMRALKEAIHEIGHMLGLGHCADARCVMYFSNMLADTDRKGHGFCRRCRAQIEGIS